MTGNDKTVEVRELRRRALLRDLFVFQGKLLLDAAKDVLLGPVALIAAIIDMVRPAPKQEMGFYRILQTGKRIEQTIDLFGAAERPADDPRWTVDDVINEVETGVREQYRLGGLSAAAKTALERTLKSVRDTGEKSE